MNGAGTQAARLLPRDAGSTQAIPRERIRLRALASRWYARTLRPVDAASLAAFRVFYGLILCISMLRFEAYGWVERLFVAPRFHFKYWGFAWVQPLPGPYMHALFWTLAALALGLALGLCFRLTATAFALGLSYVQLIDVSTYLNHYYLAALLAWLLAVSPAARIASVDAWWQRRRTLRPSLSAQHVAAGWVYLFRFQLGLVYFFAGLAKAQPDWLLHAQPLRIWLGGRTDLPLIGPLLTIDALPLLMSWAGFLFDATICLWLCWAKTRRAAYAVLVVFHVATGLLLPIGMFPVIMIAATAVFFSPSWPRRVYGSAAGKARTRARTRGWRLPRSASEHAQGALCTSDAATGNVVRTRRVRTGAWARVRALSERDRQAGTCLTWGHLGAPRFGSLSLRPGVTRDRAATRHQLGIGLGVAYCLLQLLLPLRSLAYGGNVLWHEQGMRLSWRVMLRAKGGTTTFLVHSGSGRDVQVNPREYLTEMQTSEMASQPDLIVQLAHHIRSDLRARGFGPVEVRADARASLNGRRSQPLLDPRVDLAAVVDSPLPATWILPAPTRPPPRTRPVL